MVILFIVLFSSCRSNKMVLNLHSSIEFLKNAKYQLLELSFVTIVNEDVTDDASYWRPKKSLIKIFDNKNKNL